MKRCASRRRKASYRCVGEDFPSRKGQNFPLLLFFLAREKWKIQAAFFKRLFFWKKKSAEKRVSDEKSYRKRVFLYRRKRKRENCLVPWKVWRCRWADFLFIFSRKMSCKNLLMNFLKSLQKKFHHLAKLTHENRFATAIASLTPPVRDQ